MAGRPLKFKTPEIMQEKIDAYFKKCDEKRKPYTVTGLALALDTDRETLINYQNRNDFFDTVKRAKLKCQNYAEEYLYNGKNVAGAIFNLKANYKWEDKQQLEHTGKDGEPIKNSIQIEFVKPDKE